MKVKIRNMNDWNYDKVWNLIKRHKREIKELNKKDDYYKNNMAILKRELPDYKPNFKLVAGFSKYITTMKVGYFLGKPVETYAKDEMLNEKLNDIYKYNDEASHNLELGRQSGVFGYTYEMLYVGEDYEGNAIPRMKVIDPREIIYLVDCSLEENVVGVIRYYDDDELDDKCYIVEIYDKERKREFILNGKNKTLIEEVDNEEELSFGDVPFIRYSNDDTDCGDSENVFSLMDAYNLVNSDTMNDLEAFTDAFLVIYGALNEPEGADFKQDRVINITDNEGKVEWLVKQLSENKEFKDRLVNDIHKFSFCPDLSDENFVGNSSGEAMKYKLLGLETITGIKEGIFKKGFLRRVELLCNFLNISNNSKMLADVEFKFTRNSPKNLVEEIDNVVKLTGIVSEERQLEMLSGVDVEKELERKKKEKEDELVSFDPSIFNKMDEEIDE